MGGGKRVSYHGALLPVSKKEDMMELLTVILGISIRFVLPLGLLLWASARLQAWDQRRTI